MQQLLEQGLRAVRDWGVGLKMFTFDRLSKDVDAGIYAATIRGILLHQIHIEKKVTTYGRLAQATASLPKGGQLAQALQKIAEDDFQAKRPLSTAIVVNETTGLPGTGFFKQARELGLPVDANEASEASFWRDQLFRLGEVQPLSDGPLDVLIKVGAAQGKTLDKDGELGILSGIWDAARLVAPLPAGSDGWKSVGTPLPMKVAADLDQDQTSHSWPGSIIIPPETRTVEEVAKAAEAKQGFIRIPPKDLREGDVVLNVVEGQEIVVENIRIFTKTIVNTPRVGGNATHLEREVHWTGGGVEYISPFVGIHFKVRRPTPVLGRSETTAGVMADINTDTSQKLRVSSGKLGWGKISEDDLKSDLNKKLKKRSSKKSTKR